MSNLILAILLTATGVQPLPPVPAEGTSLVVTADSLSLQSRHDYTDDATRRNISLHRGDPVVLVQAERDAADSAIVWVWLAQDSEQAGWATWDTVIRDTAPSSPVSRLLHEAVSPVGKFIASILSLAALCLCVLAVRKRRNAYLILASGLAFLLLLLFVLYMSSGDPRLWNYYLAPTLSPFAHSLPAGVRLLLILLWTDIVLWLAALLSLRGDSYVCCARCGERLEGGNGTCPKCGAVNKL